MALVFAVKGKVPRAACLFIAPSPIGQQRLKFLVPSPEDRMEAHEALRAMRGFLLASSFAHLRQHEGLIKVLDRISSDAFASLASVRVPFAAYAKNK